MAFDPTSGYQTFVDAEGELYILQNSVVYDKNGNQWNSIPASKRNKYAPPGRTPVFQDTSTGFLYTFSGMVAGTRLAASAVASSISDTVPQGTTESTLATFIVPANLLGINDGLELDMLWSCTNSAATKRIRGRFGGTVLWNLDLTTHLTFRLNFKFRNRGSRSSQISQANSTTIFAPIGSVGVQTFTTDFTVDEALTITGQFPVAGTGTNSLALEEYTFKGI